MVDHASRPVAAAAGAAPATTVRAGREGRVGDVEQLAARAQREQECAPVVAAFDAEALEVVTRVDVEGPEPAASRGRCPRHRADHMISGVARPELPR